MKRSILLRAISAVLSVITLFTVFSVNAFAETTTENLKQAYGFIIPTDSKFEKQKTSYTFYGNSATLYFMLFSKGKANAFYTVEIYSSSDYNPENLVSSFSSEFSETSGSSPAGVNWPFKSNPSGTYYGRCYASFMDGETEKIDSASICKFTINLNRVGKETVSLTSISNGSDGVTLKWTGMSTALKYRVYRKAKGESKWSKLKDVKAGTTSYVDKSAKSGTQYTYTVKAYDNMYSSLYDKKGLTTVYLSRPKLTQPKASTDVYPTIKWSKVSGAKGYYVYRKGGSLNASSSWKKIATIKDVNTLSYTDKKATSPDWYYVYTIRAYSGSYKSTYDKTGVSYNYVSEPILKSASSVNSGVKVSWYDSNTFGEKYYVYRKGGGQKSWKRIATTTSQSYTDKKVSNATKYTYTVRTASKTNTSTYDKDGISTMYLVTPTLKSASIAKNGDVTVKWNKVDSAKGYIVYKSVNGGSWKQLAKVTSGKTTSYKDTSAKKSGEKYTYTVRAYNGSYKSYYVKSGVASMYLSIPDVVAQNDYTAEKGSAIKVSWNSVTGAKTYRVYRKAQSEKSWKIIADEYKDKVYYDTTAESGVKYYYTVRAQNGDYLSSYTSTPLVTALATPILNDAVITESGVKVTWEAVGGAESYIVYKRTLEGSWEILGNSTASEYIDSSEGATETPSIYTVRAVLGDLKSNYMINGVKNYVSVDNADIFLEVSEDSELAVITVTFAGTGADSYEIRRIENGGEPTLVATVPATEKLSFVDNDLIQGATYSYIVTPIKENKLSVDYNSEACKWEFPPVPVAKIELTPKPAYSEEAVNSVVVNWLDVATAESYEIYRKTDETDWELIAVMPKDENSVENGYEYVDEAVETDIYYYYSVKGIASDRDSLFDIDGVQTVVNGPVEQVTDIFANMIDDPSNPDKKVVTLAWEAKENALFYQVMRKEDNGDWEYMGLFFNCDTLVFTDNTIEPDVRYTYTIHTYAPDRPSENNEIGVSVIWDTEDKLSQEEIVELYKASLENAKTNAASVIKVKEGAVSKPEDTFTGSLAPVAESLLNMYLAENEDAIEAKQEEVLKETLPPQNVECALTLNGIKTASYVETETEYIVTIIAKDEKMPVQGADGVGSLIDLITKEQIDEAVAVQEQVVVNDFSAEYKNVTVVATIDKATKNLTALKISAPSKVNLVADAGLITGVSATVAFERITEFSLAY